MKFGAAIPVLNEFRFLPAVVGQLLKVCDKVLVLRSTKTHSGAEAPFLAAPPVLPPRCELVTGDWANETATRNYGQETLAAEGFDYVFSLDSDEIFTDKVLTWVTELVSNTSTPIEMLACRMFTYWKNPETMIDPPEELYAPFLLRKDVRFIGGRIPAGKGTAIPRCLLHHLSYVRTDEEVQAKMKFFCHAAEVNPDWYEKVWKAYDVNPWMENLHPTHPTAYKRTVAAPPDVKKILDEHGVVWP